jgi:hypothetical protein
MDRLVVSIILHTEDTSFTVAQKQFHTFYNHDGSTEKENNGSAVLEFLNNLWELGTV